jgi:uncharacterized protein (TIGR02646 family)
MIKIEKNYASIPESLIPGFADLFPNRQTVPYITRTTHEKRIEIINNGAYIDEGKYNDRYKKDDIRIALNTIYKYKCAYCEEKVEQYHIEHYRPKKIYHWLAFSWDNLILACATCNEGKGINFDLDGKKVDFVNIEENIRSINISSKAYDEIELPKMVNPEVTDPLGKITFKPSGEIESDDERFKYTIEKCSIDRPYLNVERKRLLDIFKRDFTSALVDNKTPEEQQKEITVIIKKFIRDAHDSELQFLAFRNFAIKSQWLNNIAKGIN